MYYVKDYYTDKIIDITDNLFNAKEISRHTENTIVTDEKGNKYYINIDLPFC